MPKVLERDPAWLAGSDSLVADIFRNNKSSRPPSSGADNGRTPQRTIASRGTELFVAVGNELRWSDLAAMKDGGHGQQRAYRVLKTPAHRDIAQLSVAPSGDYVAISTSHTCHVCILPSPSHLQVHDDTPLRLKSFQLGPTAHVVEQAPLVSGIWHPLSHTQSCFVTVTHDACVRMWELDSENRSTFNEPALAFDLKKLGNAGSTQVDFTASRYGANRAFSPDDVEMQVAGACFGGQGRDDEHGWASMTLWVAMTEGDVYSLCPFLPSKWFAPASLLPTLSTTVTERAHAIRLDDEATERQRRVVDEQSKWLANVDAQDPLLMPGRSEFETVEVYSRPDVLNPIPKLQGPFSISPEPDFGEITDIFVIAPKTDDEALFDDDYEDVESDEGLSVSIVCLATSTNEVHVCLGLDGVEAEWLPRKRSRIYTFDDVEDAKELLLYETIDLAQTEAEDDGWPTFTASPVDRYEFFVTYPRGVCGVSLRPWIGMLEDELSSTIDSGVGVRLNAVLSSLSTVVDQPIAVPNDIEGDLRQALALVDLSVGFVLLTTSESSPFAAILDLPSSPVNHPYLPDNSPAAAALPAPQPRAPYRPAATFDQTSTLPQLIRTAKEKNLLGGDVKAPVRFSPATLQLMTEAHRVMSSETHRLGVAAADLFRRCERMQVELQEQIRRVADMAEKVDHATGADDVDDAGTNEDTLALVGNEKIHHRITQTQDKTAILNRRLDALQRRMRLVGGKKLSAKELALVEEVQRLEQSILQHPGSGASSMVNVRGGDSPSASSLVPSRSESLATRFDAVQALQLQLVGEVENVELQSKTDEEEGAKQTSSPAKPRPTIRNDFRKQKLAQVMALLEREEALVAAVLERLRRLTTSEA